MSESKRIRKNFFFKETLSLKPWFKVVFAFVFNVIVLIVFLLCTSLRFEIQDNYYYSLFINDGYYDFGFMSYFFCLMCGLLQKIIYPINAFTILHLLFSLLSFSIITLVFIDKFKYLYGTLFSVFILSFFAVNHYSNISFTRDPALFVVAGMLCVIHFYKKSVTLTVFGGFIVLVSSFYRFEVFLSGLGIITFYIIGKSFTEYFNQNKKTLRDFINILFNKKRIWICIIIVAITFSGQFISVAICNSYEEGHYFQEYTSVRSKVWDYPIPDYEVCKKEYNAIGFDSNDVSMLRSGYMDDEGGYSLEKLKEVQNIQTKYNKSHRDYIGIIKMTALTRFVNLINLNEEGVAIIGALFILVSFLLIMEKRYYFIPFSMLIISSVLLVYLTTYGRVPFRAVYIIWLSLSVFICYSFSKDDFHFQKLLSKFPKAIGGFTSVCLVLISLFGITFSVNANSTIPTFDNNNDVIALRNYLNENLDKRYELARSVVVDDCSEVYLIDDVWKNNYLIFNCTYYRSRFFEKQMSILDVNNMYSDLLGKEIFWIDKKNQSHKDMFEQYLNKYYSHGKKINMQVTDCIGDYVVYMISE